MAYGDVRIVSFLYNQWLIPGDTLTRTVEFACQEPITSVTSLGISGSTASCLVTAGTFRGTGQVSCHITTTEGEEATTTVYIPVAPLAP